MKRATRNLAVFSLALASLVVSVLGAGPATAQPAERPSCPVKVHKPVLSADGKKISATAEITTCAGTRQYKLKVTLQQHKVGIFWNNKASDTESGSPGKATKVTATWKCGSGTGKDTYKAVTDVTFDGRTIGGPESSEVTITCPS